METTVPTDTVDPRQARAALALVTLGLLLTLTGALLLSRPAAFTLVLLPLLAFVAVLRRVRA
jgi:hypothetical protein